MLIKILEDIIAHEVSYFCISLIIFAQIYLKELFDIIEDHMEASTDETER